MVGVFSTTCSVCGAVASTDSPMGWQQKGMFWVCCVCQDNSVIDDGQTVYLLRDIVVV